MKEAKTGPKCYKRGDPVSSEERSFEDYNFESGNHSDIIFLPSLVNPLGRDDS
jgi:hypothetical protein